MKYWFYKNKTKILFTTITVVLLIIATLYVNTAGFKRDLRNLQSEFSGGIKREIIIFSADGEEVFKLHGKFDFTYDSKCIEYIDTATGKKHNIFAGDNTVVLINEID